jgi:hypothetical protein
MDVYVIKTDAIGNIVWSKSFGNKPFYDYGNAILESEDGGYFVAGATKSIVDNHKIYDNDVYLVKLDSGGNVLWENTYGGSGSDWARCASAAGNGGLVIAGHTDSEGEGFFDVLFVRIYDR